MGRPVVDVQGKTYGMLAVERQDVARSGARRTFWICRCSCGQTTSVRVDALRRGQISCGCIAWNIEGATRKTHGLSSLPEYQIWAAMIRRCENKKAKGFKNYGGRGIAVCDRWRRNFEDFYADMGKRPSDQHTIERKDNSGNYEPDNCVWLPQSKQALNRRNNTVICCDGVKQTIAEWSVALKLRQATISGRISRGWSVERALKTPPAYRGPNQHARRGAQRSAA